MTRTFCTLLLLAPWLAACGADEARLTPASTAHDGSEEVLPQTRNGILVLEGDAQPVTLHLFHAPDGFELPFHTYLPPGMLPASPSGREMRFLAAFSGEPDPRARMVVSLLPADASPLELLDFVDREVEARGGHRMDAPPAAPSSRTTPMRRYPWGEAEWWISTPEEEATLILGSRQGTPFLLEVAHPPELEEGFLPRVGWTLEEWRWGPDGTPLIPSPPGAGWEEG